MDLYDSHLKHIIKANDENRLAIFIGSGISKSSDTSSFEMPLWEDLISSMKSDLQSCDETDYLKIAQLYFLEFEETNYFNKIKSFFPDNIPPSELHKTIFELNPNCVITTNWDCLLESAIETTGALYSVVCSDKDLVKSTMNKKLIKMHGDFKNHNIVFKEDDYLSYSHNFPLIENYIKSILSTHTVLFLGYSYNDVNLKQIMKWIQNNSKYSPSKYLVVSKENRSQSNYLKNHGIKTLILQPAEEILTEINRYFLLPERSKKVAYLLNDIKNSKFKKEKDLSDSEVIELVTQKVNHLQSLNFVLIDQIRDSLSNSGYEYDLNAYAILELYTENGALTTDYNKSTRLIHTRFVDILKVRDDKSTLIKNKGIANFMETLAKAKVSGIMLNTEDKQNRSYYVNPKKISDEEIYDALSFKLEPIDDYNSSDIKKSLEISKFYYETYNFKQAYYKTSEIITTCKSQKNYSLLLIAIFNINNIINKLKYSLNSERTVWERELENVDLQEQFLQLPKSEIKKQQVLYDFISLKSIYIQSFKNNNYLTGVVNAVESTKNGGLNFNNQAEKPAVEQANIILFTTMNNILVNNKIFYETMEKFVEISIARQSLKEEVTLSIYDIFTCIKYFENKKLKKLYEKHFYSEESLNKKLTIEDKALNWLIETVLPNIMNHHLSANSSIEYKDSELSNTIYLLSFLYLNKNRTNSVINTFNKLVSSKKNTLSTYESINYFLAIQHNLHKNKIDPELLISLIESIINKVVYKDANGWDIHAITTNSITNIYDSIAINNGIYDNTKLVEKLIVEISELEIKDRIKYSRSLIHSIFNIGSDSVKEIIKSFINEIIEITSNTERFELNLWFVASGYVEEVTDELITELKKYLVDYLNSSSFSSELYSLRAVTKYLIDEKNHLNLEECKELIDKIIDKYESSPKISTI